jgi:hypothetical protein
LNRALEHTGWNQVKNIKYQLRIKGLATADGTIPVRALLELFHHLTDCAERGLRLAIEGASIKSGRPPVWLEKAVGLTLSGLEKGSTILDIEAPVLGEIIGPELQQQDFWVKAPSSEDTALSLFAKSVLDTTSENLESNYYDAGVLKALLGFKSFLKTDAKSVELFSRLRPQENVKLTMEEMEKAERLKICTPEPQATIISGQLDAIQHSRKRFELVLPEGQVVPGRINEEFLSPEKLREFWGKDVTVKGVVHFRPSGRIQLLDAQIIKPKEPGEEVFSEMPTVQSEAEFLATTLQAANGKDWLKEIWGKWPGDEPIEEILEGLKR